MTQEDEQLLNRFQALIKREWQVDAIYLYGSRAQNTARPDSDWDLAILFHNFINNRIERVLRPQEVEAYLEEQTKAYDKISIIDLELVPAPLQFNVIRGQRLYDRNVPHVRRTENAIYSRIELDYER
ncbi:MAG: DNA polymerase subunit beta [SAR324 cluster bacterium]|uniref:DNA polymerase subunit beta n=1 Tax=SAR324 cluster bacterium TaxID=2024889 RepID=A0A2A4SZU2_9DELT|nr:MAG: DNA polymerase subunit beta [SAR324 cluster bacterium]